MRSRTTARPSGARSDSSSPLSSPSGCLPSPSRPSPARTPTRASARTRRTTRATTPANPTTPAVRPARTRSIRTPRASASPRPGRSTARRTRTCRRPPASRPRTPLPGATRPGSSPACRRTGRGSGPIGRPDVQIAILDTGIRWRDTELRTQVALNEGELPLPQQAGGAACSARDCNGDGAYNVDDYAADPRVAKNSGRDDEAGRRQAPRRVRPDRRLLRRQGLRRQRLHRRHRRLGLLRRRQRPVRRFELLVGREPRLRAGQGGGRAPRTTARATPASARAARSCRCASGTRSSPTRATSRQATLYAADNRIEVVESAIGGLSNPRFAREAFRVAYRKGAVPRGRVVRPQHGQPQHPDRLRRGDAGAGRRARHRGARLVGRRGGGQLPGRDRDSHRGAGPDVVPQLRDDPVRRATRTSSCPRRRARRRPGRRRAPPGWSSPTRATRGSTSRPTRSSRSSR